MSEPTVVVVTHDEPEPAPEPAPEPVPVVVTVETPEPEKGPEDMHCEHCAEHAAAIENLRNEVERVREESHREPEVVVEPEPEPTPEPEPEPDTAPRREHPFFSDHPFARD